MQRQNLSKRDFVRTPEALLLFFVLALLLGMIIGLGGYVYVSASRTLSEYRRHLNAAAYQAQLYFDQREVLIRALAATSFQPPSGQASRAGGGFGVDGPAVPLPVADGEKASRMLFLTPRYLDAIRRVGTLVYAQPSFSMVARLAVDGKRPSWHLASGDDARGFLRVNDAPQGRMAPVVWLGGISRKADTLIAYSPLDRRDAHSGWLGLELHDLQNVLAPDFLPPGTLYGLYDREGLVVVERGGLSHAMSTDRFAADYYGFAGEGWLPRYVLLSKSIGVGGLRVKYALPVARLLRDEAPVIGRAVGLVSVFALGVLLFARQIRRRVLAPMRRQYRELSESLTLNQTILAMAPIGLALVDNERHAVHLANAFARSWLAEDAQWRDRIPGPGEADRRTEASLPDWRVLHVDAVVLEYQGRRAALCLIRDVSARKRIEDNLARSHRLAEEANQAKTRFLAMLSHEIRTPLHGITGTLELFEPSDIPPGKQPYFEALAHSVKTLLRIVNDALDLSQIEAGRIHIESRAFGPADLVDEVVAAYEAAARVKGLHLYALMNVEMERVLLGDSLRLRQILGNLVSNAIKFTASGHVIIRAQARPDERGMALRFQVVDSGVGIDPDDLPYLFEPYFSPGKNEQGKAAGTGLGLTISRMLAELMGGGLQVVSEPGLGTSMALDVTLPLAETAPEVPRRIPVLDPQRVWVAGAAPEIVGNVCQWLRHWGAWAVPEDDRPPKAGDLRVCLNQYPGTASGRRARVRIERVRTDVDGGRAGADASVAWVADPSVRAIGLAIEALQGTPGPVAAGAGVPAADARASVRFQGRKALLVDDHPVNLLVLGNQLRRLGYEVAQERSAEAALRRDDLDSFAAILTDVRMSGMDGYALSRALRGRGYDGVVFGVTADPLARSQRRWAAAGMDDLLVKPFSFSVLEDRLDAHAPSGDM